MTTFKKRIGFWSIFLVAVALSCLVLNNLFLWNYHFALDCARRDTGIDANTGRERSALYIANIKIKERIGETDFSRKMQQLTGRLPAADWRLVISSPLLSPQRSASVYGQGFGWQRVILNDIELGKIDEGLHRQIAETYIFLFKTGDHSRISHYVNAVSALAFGQKVISAGNAPAWLLTGSNVPPVTEEMIR